MAKIIGLKEKQTALKDIQLSLRSIVPLDAFIEATNASNEYTISFDSHKATLKCDEKEKINALVLDFKRSIVEHIQELSQKFEIELDEDDLALMKL